MKVLFIVPYPFDTTPSQRLKFEQYFEYFRQNGVEIGFSSFVSPELRKILYKKGHTLKKVLYTFFGYFRRISDIFKASRYDMIYLHLEAAPFGPPIFEYIFYMLGKPIIYDIDDVIYIPNVSDANRFIKVLKNPKKIQTIMRLSKHVVVVTDYLGRFAQRFNKNITYIPPTINTDKYSIANKSDNRKICVGWTGSHSTSKYIYLIEKVLKEISRSCDVRFKVIGDANFKIDGLDMEAKDWSSETEVGDIQDIDIGLYPLPKNEWVMGKGGLKALQYMGMGIPVVCTRVGAVLNFIQDGVNGFLADSDKEWVEKISELIKDADLRKRIGSAARKTVEEKFSVKVNAPRHLEIIKKVYNENANSRNV